MQKFILKIAALGLALAAMLFTACDPDNPGGGGTGGGGTVLGPEINLLAGTDVQNVDFDAETTETSFTVIVETIKGDGDLNTLTIKEGSDNLSTDRFTISGGGVSASNNPLLIAGTAIEGAQYTIDITLPSPIVEGDFFLYEFTVADKNMETATTSIAVTIVAPPGTPLDNPAGIGGVLLNQAGPAGTGGLDLGTGNGTGSMDAAAEIRDLGIDCTINPNDAENWRAEFGTVNGAEMVRVDATQIENFSYDNVTTKETIQDAFAGTGAIALADGVSQAPNCDETAVTDVTGAVAVGDLFIVKSADVYYLLRVDAINPMSGNGDNFEFSVKF